MSLKPKQHNGNQRACTKQGYLHFTLWDSFCTVRWIPEVPLAHTKPTSESLDELGMSGWVWYGVWCVSLRLSPVFLEILYGWIEGCEKSKNILNSLSPFYFICLIQHICWAFVSMMRTEAICPLHDLENRKSLPWRLLQLYWMPALRRLLSQLWYS